MCTSPTAVVPLGLCRPDSARSTLSTNVCVRNLVHEHARTRLCVGIHALSLSLSLSLSRSPSRSVRAHLRVQVLTRVSARASVCAHLSVNAAYLWIENVAEAMEILPASKRGALVPDCAYLAVPGDLRVTLGINITIAFVSFQH